MSKRVLTKESCEEIISLRRQGLKITAIEKEMFLSRSTIYANLHHYGMMRKYEKANDEYQSYVSRKAIELRRKGLKRAEILEELNINSSPTLTDILRNQGKLDVFKKAISSEVYREMRTKCTANRKRLNFSWVYNQRAVFGRTYPDIAEELGCHPHLIYKFCKKYNIPKADKQTALANRSNVNDALEKAW